MTKVDEYDEDCAKLAAYADKLDSDGLNGIPVARAAALLHIARARIGALEAKLQRVRDFWKFQANSEGGIVDEIDGLLSPPPARDAEEGRDG